MSEYRQSNQQKRRRRGFERASQLVGNRLRTAGESRGFAVTRLLTHWSDIVGPDIASVARPVEVTYGRGFGATLKVLTTGAQAPMLEMQKEAIREKVNACYGYAAIQTVRLTQTAETGFSEGRAVFEMETKNRERQNCVVPEEATEAASGVGDEDLRQALELLGANVISRRKQ